MEGDINMDIYLNDPFVDLNEIYWYNWLAFAIDESETQSLSYETKG